MIEQISQDIISFPASMSVAELYAKCPGKALFVEPLSAKIPISNFIASGGLGYGSLVNGTFSSRLYKVQTREFTSGSNYSTNTNAGYPLHRLVERAPHNLSPIPSGDIIRVTVPVREKPNVKVLFKSCNIGETKPSPVASSFLWVNEPAAKAIGVRSAGVISVFESEPEGEGEPADNIYERRFFEDYLPSGQTVFKALTMPSNLVKMKELADKSDSFFVAFYVHLGVLVVFSGVSEKLKQIASEIVTLPMTFVLQNGKG